MSEVRMQRDAWLHVPRRLQGTSRRIYCFPHAGGRAQVFNGWPEHLPLDVEVAGLQLPGRGTRLGETPFDELEPLMDSLLQILGPDLEDPYCLYGHSLGALLAFEFARRAGERGLPEPEVLFVAAHGPPHLPSSDEPLSELAESALKQELEGLAGTQPGVLDSDEMMEVLLPSIRADFRLYERYEYVPGTPIDAPIVAFAGLADPVVDRARIGDWSMHTTADLEVHRLPGDHFFPHRAEPVLVDLIARRLQRQAVPS